MSTAKTQQRISFSTVKNRVPYPDLLEVQLKSFRDFFQMDTTAENRKSEGLYKVFQENFPITDTRNNFVLEFIDYYIDPPRYSGLVAHLGNLKHCGLRIAIADDHI